MAHFMMMNQKLIQRTQEIKKYRNTWQNYLPYSTVNRLRH